MNNGHCLKFDEENNLKLEIFGFRCNPKHLNTHIYIYRGKQRTKKREKHTRVNKRNNMLYIRRYKKLVEKGRE
jgi:hypothetical protein